MEPKSPANPKRHDLWVGAWAILWFLGLLGGLFSVLVLGNASWLIVAALAVVALLAGLAISRFRAGRWRSLPRSAIGAFCFLAILAAAPVIVAAFYAQLRPLVVPQVVLRNGDRTIIFQGMVHVASASFYEGVVYEMERAMSEDFTLFYEGVDARTPQGRQWFSKVLAGGGDLSANYTKLADSCGLTFQGNYLPVVERLRATDPDHHIRADVDAEDMMAEVARLSSSDPALKSYVDDKLNGASAKQDQENSDGLASLVEWMRGQKAGMRAAAATLCRGLMSYLISQERPSQADPIILDFRNRALAQRIIASPQKKIFITYGARHFSGLMQDLNRAKSGWKIESVTWRRGIEAPDQVRGRLPAY